MRPRRRKECVYNIVRGRTGEPFSGRVAKFPTHFQEIISRAHGNFEQQYKVLGSSKIIIKYCNIIMHIIIKELPNKYYISNKGLLEECDQEEHVEVNWGRYYFLFGKKILKRLVQCHVFVQSPSGRRPMINMQSTLRTAPDLCTNVTLAVLLGSSGNSYSLYAVRCVYIHMSFTILRRLSGKNLYIYGTAMKAACHFGHGCYRLGSLVLGYDI